MKRIHIMHNDKMQVFVCLFIYLFLVLFSVILTKGKSDPKVKLEQIVHLFVFVCINYI